ncbi:hypothetical protein TNCV_2536831 [Trichonephila clavipes]|nr:hypothetical protein TNCV_2536831 [Trichonephila clavipes]
MALHSLSVIYRIASTGRDAGKPFKRSSITSETCSTCERSGENDVQESIDVTCLQCEVECYLASKGLWVHPMEGSGVTYSPTSSGEL